MFVRLLQSSWDDVDRAVTFCRGSVVVEREINMTVGVAIDWGVNRRDDGEEEDMRRDIAMLKEIEGLLEDAEVEVAWYDNAEGHDTGAI